MGRWQREALTEGLMTQRRCPSTTRFASGPPPHRCATGGSATTVPHPPRPPHLAASRPDDYSRSMSDAKIRSEEHTSELKSLMRISYAVFCLKKKTIMTQIKRHETLTITDQHTHNSS